MEFPRGPEVSQLGTVTLCPTPDFWTCSNPRSWIWPTGQGLMTPVLHASHPSINEVSCLPWEIWWIYSPVWHSCKCEADKRPGSRVVYRQDRTMFQQGPSMCCYQVKEQDREKRWERNHKVSQGISQYYRDAKANSGLGKSCFKEACKVSLSHLHSEKKAKRKVRWISSQSKEQTNRYCLNGAAFSAISSESRRDCIQVLC